MAKKRGNNEGSIVRRKDGLWMAQMTVGRNPETGKPKRATFYGKTRKEVADKLAKALQDKNQGTFVVPHKLTLGEWLDTWLWDYKKPSLRPVTFDSYEQHVRCHLKPALGTIPVRDLRPELLQHFYNEKTKEGLSGRTVRYCHTLLYGALSQAERNQLVVRNVTALVEPPRKQRKEMPTLTQEQVANQLLPAIADDRLAAAIFMLFGTGLRRGELLGLRWKDVDLDESILHVRQTLGRVRIHDAKSHEQKTRLTFQEPKTDQSRRTIPIPLTCLTALRMHKAHQAEEKLSMGQAYQDRGLVFSRPDGRPIDPSELSRHFGRLLRRVGLPSIRLHDARHTYATLLLELGEGPKVVQSLMGHSSVSITLDIYSHVNLELERKAASKLNTALTGGK
jgi:integrase